VDGGAKILQASADFLAIAKSAPECALSLLKQFTREHAVRHSTILRHLPFDCPLSDLQRCQEIAVPALVIGIRLDPVNPCEIARSEYPAAKPRVVLGHEYAGEVVAVGDGVKGLSVGDLVAVDPNILCLQCAFCREGMVHLCIRPENIGSRDDGGLAEYALCPA